MKIRLSLIQSSSDSKQKIETVCKRTRNFNSIKFSPNVQRVGRNSSWKCQKHYCRQFRRQRKKVFLFLIESVETERVREDDRYMTARWRSLTHRLNSCSLYTRFRGIACHWTLCRSDGIIYERSPKQTENIYWIYVARLALSLFYKNEAKKRSVKMCSVISLVELFLYIILSAFVWYIDITNWII